MELSIIFAVSYTEQYPNYCDAFFFSLILKWKAHGVYKEVIVVRKAVVNSITLEIHFKSTGKGTTNVPKRRVYGSLISAISVESGE